MVITRSKSAHTTKLAVSPRRPAQTRMPSKGQNAKTAIRGERSSTRIQLQNRAAKVSFKEDSSSSSSGEEDDPTDKTYRSGSEGRVREAKTISELKRKYVFAPEAENATAKKKAKARVVKKNEAMTETEVEAIVGPDLVAGQRCSTPPSPPLPDVKFPSRESTLTPIPEDFATVETFESEAPVVNDKRSSSHQEEGVVQSVIPIAIAEKQDSPIPTSEISVAACALGTAGTRQDRLNGDMALTISNLNTDVSQFNATTLLPSAEEEVQAVLVKATDVVDGQSVQERSQDTTTSMTGSLTRPTIPDWAKADDHKVKEEYVVRSVEQDKNGVIVLSAPVESSILGANSDEDKATAISTIPALSNVIDGQGSGDISVLPHHEDDARTPNTHEKAHECPPEVISQVAQVTQKEVPSLESQKHTLEVSPIAAEGGTPSQPTSKEVDEPSEQLRFPAITVPPIPVASISNTPLMGVEPPGPVQSLLPLRIKVLRQNLQDTFTPQLLKGTPSRCPAPTETEIASTESTLLPRPTRPRRAATAPRASNKKAPTKPSIPRKPKKEKNISVQDEQVVLSYEKVIGLLNEENIRIMIAGMDAIKIDKSQNWNQQEISTIEVLATWSLLKRQILGLPIHEGVADKSIAPSSHNLISRLVSVSPPAQWQNLGR